MDVIIPGRELPLKGKPDALLISSEYDPEVDPSRPVYLRIDQMFLEHADALRYLSSCGFSSDEAREYIDSLPREMF